MFETHELNADRSEGCALEIPIGSVLTAVAAVLAVIVSNMLSSRNSTEGKLWDMRREGYSLILFELGAIERLFDSADEIIEQYGFGGYWDTNVRPRHEAELYERMKKIRDRVSNDYLVFSDAFLATFNEFEKANRLDDYNSSPDEEYDRFASAVRRFRPRLRNLCRAEIRSARQKWLSL